MIPYLISLTIIISVASLVGYAGYYYTTIREEKRIKEYLAKQKAKQLQQQNPFANNAKRYKTKKPF